jgi:hypothetical protein
MKAKNLKLSAKLCHNKEMKRTIRERILNPKPNSKVAAAIEFGIDLTLNISKLQLTPNQRIINLQLSMKNLDQFRKEAHNWRLKRDSRS